MADTVIMHVGLMKSASSYLQDLCELNAAALLERGLLWPGQRFNFEATNDLLGTNRRRTADSGQWDDMAARIAGHPGNVLISNEILSLRPHRKVRPLVEALEGCELRVIITARDLGRVIPSQWQEGTRNRRTTTWADFVDALVSDDDTAAAGVRWFWQRQNLPAILRRWQNLVGADRVWLLTVPPPGSPQTLMGERFAGLLGLSGAFTQQPPPSHLTLGAHSAELMRRLNEIVDLDNREAYRDRYHHSIAREQLEPLRSAEPAIRLDPKHHDWVRARAEQLIDDVAALEPNLVGDLAELIPREETSPGFDPSESTDAELLQAALNAMSGLGAEVARLKHERDDLIEWYEELGDD